LRLHGGRRDECACCGKRADDVTNETIPHDAFLLDARNESALLR
jgi:hypothetical protein